ncbi:hypothetical protein AB0C10_16190 [Microbispora amethystogenes]|uniref:hypothetical protein n=1 Tax=Microbispora amethystogenes TaxID=1427754 RepID=UPI00340880BD
MARPYGWLITQDYVSGTECTVIGPRGVSDDILRRLEAGEGRTFRLLDGDGGLDYEGRIIVAPEDDDGELLFRPLDWAKHDSGSASIQYRNKKTGEWEDL